LRDGRAERCPVGVGLSNSREAEIRSGLSEGDEVLLYPSEKVRDGIRVQRNHPQSPN
jgi:HlyD family secretion protein